MATPAALWRGCGWWRCECQHFGRRACAFCSAGVDASVLRGASPQLQLLQKWTRRHPNVLVEAPGEPLWHAIPACRRAQLSRLRDAMAGTARITAPPPSTVESKSAWQSHLMPAGRCSSTFRVPERSEALPTSLAASSVPAVRASSLGRVGPSRFKITLAPPSPANASACAVSCPKLPWPP